MELLLCISPSQIQIVTNPKGLGYTTQAGLKLAAILTLECWD